MSTRKIHPTAIIEPGAIIGENVTIEPYVIIKENVVIRDGVTIKAHVYIDGYTTIGENSTIYPSTSIGTKTQDLKFRGEKTYVKIGKNCEIREFVTINSSSQENSVVEVGDNCLLMAYCHVAHNCVVGNRVIMSNGATLAGHVNIADNAIIGGLTPIHQFVSIGRNSMVGGMSRITHDIPPFTLGGGIPYKYGGLNIIGLKRAGFSLQLRQELSRAFKLVFRSKLRLSESIARCEEELELFDEVMHFIQFCKTSKRGLMGQQGVTRDTSDSEEKELVNQE